MLEKLKSFHFRDYLPILDDVSSYTWAKFKADLIAGVTVGIVELPQSMAYAMIAGVHPKYGLYAAIFPTIVASFFGASRFLASGPTNAIAMLIPSSLAAVTIGGTAVSALPEDERIALVFLLSFLVGVIQLAMGFLRFGNFLKFVSHSVVVGFTSGAAVLIAFNQLKNLLGVKIGNHVEFVEVIKYTVLASPKTNYYALSLGVFTIAFVLFFKKRYKKFPAPLVSLVACSGIVAWFGLEAKGVYTVGNIPQSLPPISDLPFSYEKIHALLAPAMAIAILGIVEALSIVKSVASKAGDKVKGDQEFIAQGLANVTAGLLSGIPGSGSFTRSAVNFSAGAQSRFSVIFSGIFILIVLVAAAPLARYIPTAALAGILMVIAYGMIDVKSIRSAMLTTSEDKWVIITTFVSTLLLELDKAVYVGVFLSIALFVKRVSLPEVYKVVPDQYHSHFMESLAGESKECRQLSIYQVNGSLFFGAIEDLEKKLYSFDLDHDNCIIIRMKQVRMVDASAVHSLENFVEECRKRKTKVIFTGVKPAVMEAFERSGLRSHLDDDSFAANTKSAISVFFAKYCNKGTCEDCQARLWRECPGRKA